MSVPPPEFSQAAAVLAPYLEDRGSKVVAVDGRSGAGKTTLARFLGWHFNRPVLELDLFLRKGGLKFRQAEVRRIIQFCKDLRRPVVVEGLTVVRVLKSIDVEADCVVYVENRQYPDGLAFVKELARYEAAYRPRELAKWVVTLDH